MSFSRTTNVIKNSGASLLYKMSRVLCSFALRTAFIFFLGNEYTGVAGLFTDILTVLSLMELGLDTSMTYALYGPIANGDQRKVSALLNFFKKAFTLIGVFILILGLCCIPFLHHIVNGVPNIKEDIRLIFLMYILTSSSSYFLIYRTLLLKAYQRSRVISKVTIVADLIETAISISLLFFFREFFVYLITHLVFTWCKNIYLSRLTTKLYPESFHMADAELTEGEKKLLIRDIACLTMYTLSGVVINSTDSIFISAFVGTVEIAIIGNFTLLINSVRTTVEQINTALKPSVGNLAATASIEKQEDVFYKLNFICFWIGCFTATCLYTLLNPFVGDIWLGESYKITQILIVVLVANYYIAVMVFPIESFRTANGLFVQGWGRPVIMAFFNLILDIILGKTWGVFGILIATTISRLSTQAWFDPYLVFKHVFQKKPWHYYKSYMIYACATILSCILTGFMTSFIITKNVYICFGIKMVIAVLMPNLLVAMFFHKTEEFSFSIGLLKNRFAKALLKKS